MPEYARYHQTAMSGRAAEMVTATGSVPVGRLLS